MKTPEHIKQKILEETLNAYGDSNGLKTRILRFRASESVDPQTAKIIMDEVCSSYNNFDSEILSEFPDDCQIFIAREGSVCLYVKQGELPLPEIGDERDTLKSNTFGVGHRTDYGGYEGEVRYWWD